VSRRPVRDPARTARRVAGLRADGLPAGSGRRGFRGLRRRATGDDGVSAIELVLFMPLMFLAIFATVQFGFVFLGNSAASSAARETARIVRAGDGSPESVDEARARGNEILATIGKGLYDDGQPPTIDIDQPAPGEVRVTVTVKGVSVVPGLPSPTLEQVVQGPLEEFRGDPGV
jgi:hypothetical protein